MNVIYKLHWNDMDINITAVRGAIWQKTLARKTASVNSCLEHVCRAAKNLRAYVELWKSSKQIANAIIIDSHKR